MEQRNNWITHFEWLSALGTFVICFVFLYTQIKDLDRDVRCQIQEVRTQMITQNARSDRLYEMFIDLLKDKK